MIDLQEKLFEKSEIEFIEILKDKQKDMQDKIKQKNEERNNVIAKLETIEERRQSNSQRYNRQQINNTESVLESINEIIRNYTVLENKLYEINKELILLKEKNKLKIEEDNNEEVDFIKQQIARAIELEKSVKEENAKYSLVIDNFWETVSLRENNENKVINAEVENKSLADNLVLRISEWKKSVFLPYTKTEVETLLKNYPKEYKNENDVIEQEFVTHISIYNKRPAFARFREAYSLCRNKEMKSSIDSFKFGVEMMFKSEINPTIIAAVKSQKQLEDYIECLENNDLESFKHFEIIFEVAPI